MECYRRIPTTLVSRRAPSHPYLDLTHRSHSPGRNSGKYRPTREDVLFAPLDYRCMIGPEKRIGQVPH
jgi:hypothetical protein